VIRDIGVYFASNIGKEFSYNKLAVNFELGSVNTVQSYVSYFEDAYLFFTVPRFSFSLKQQAKNQKKIYGVDTGLIANLSLSFSKDFGRLLENAVFIEFRRRGKKLYYYKNIGECDFVVTNGNIVEQLVQVCFDINSDNLQRETKGLLDAMNVLNKTSGLILTMDQTDKIQEGTKVIEILPVWQWLLKSD
jgi:predicted AAA+ superfamily ATPase